MPALERVVAVGECGRNAGVFGERYASRGRVADIRPVDVEVPRLPAAAGDLAQNTARFAQAP